MGAPKAQGVRSPRAQGLQRTLHHEDPPAHRGLRSHPGRVVLAQVPAPLLGLGLPGRSPEGPVGGKAAAGRHLGFRTGDGS